MQGGGWRAWVASNAKAAKPNEARNEIDRLRAELRGDFRSALRHAYLGPRSHKTSFHSCNGAACSLIEIWLLRKMPLSAPTFPMLQYHPG